jgi:hypothetical protein
MSFLVPQLDESSLHSGNCGPASVASLMRWATDHDVAPTPDQVRRRMGDFVGGTTMDEHKVAWDSFIPQAKEKGWEMSPMNYRGVTKFEEMVNAIRNGRAVTVAIDYKMVPPPYKCSTKFNGFHSVMCNKIRMMNGKAMAKVWDPLADGRYRGCPRGPIWYPVTLLRDVCGGVEGPGRVIWNSVKHAILIDEHYAHPNPDADATDGVIKKR